MSFTRGDSLVADVFLNVGSLGRLRVYLLPFPALHFSSSKIQAVNPLQISMLESIDSSTRATNLNGRRARRAMMAAITACVLAVHLGGYFVTADTASLRSKLSGLGIDAVFPGDQNYEKFSNSFNRRLSYKPAAIVFPNNTNAVASAVKLGVEEKLPLSPRSGGHSYAAYGLGGTDGTLVIDLQRINSISVDGSTGEAVIGAGIRLGDIAVALNAQGGRALPHGLCPYVGLGGHAAFGGYGFTSRQWGLTLDRIVSHEVVLADGSIVTTSSTAHPDLFWALRGAGGSYGIMTAIRFRTEPAPKEATNFGIRWNMNEEDFAQTLIKFQTFCMSDVPAQLGITVNLRKSKQSGKLLFDFAGAWYGEGSAFAGAVQPFLSQMPAPTATSAKTTDWITGLSSIIGDATLSTANVDLTEEYDTFYAKSLTTPQSTPLSNSSMAAFAKVLANQGLQSSTDWFVQFELYGGKNSAVTAVGADETAFAQRSILFTIQFYARSSNKSPPYPTEGFTLLDNMVDSLVINNPSGWNYGAYANYVDERLSPSQWPNQYYKDHYERLTQIKGVYDPQNVFSNPQGITTLFNK
ncbi:hypothetical protein PGTUg99_006605 [Puccinia graminis f. sp. tritici]|uniref:FAD-binding PCMH-type domain-containing protein n=1 Tax=Puccinia graminis f. sp. tritici TaxID=56615 RepID=A0A5B0M3R6_PUCGR|nr:hypothetical protein PGTUg99_006605 [Puccinia graminis f. sp. tritici]